MILVELLVLMAFCAMAYAFGYSFGRERGMRNERGRVMSLIQQTFNTRLSGTVRWVLNSVSSGEEELMPEDEFFGPPAENSKTQLKVVGKPQ